jgi:antitoxin component YwqK of YwqJK toxin-antitoxin module
MDSLDNPYTDNPVPCKCKGSIVIHKACLDNLIKNSRKCSICKSKYNIHYLPSKDGLELIRETEINGDVTEYTVDEDEEYHGEYTLRKSTGELMMHCYYVHGELHGEFKSWYKNGQIESHCNCLNNRIEGVYKAWYENGTQREQSVYKNGLKDGLLTLWDENGNKIWSRSYMRGEEVLAQEF